MDSWFEVALTATIFAVGNIVFGHFEAETPKWRRVLKVFLELGLVRLLAVQLGRTWALGFLGLMAVLFVIVHAWWLPRKGVNGLTGEPKARYYELRGWRLPPSESEIRSKIQ
jgi:hypothetical protein